MVKVKGNFIIGMEKSDYSFGKYMRVLDSITFDKEDKVELTNNVIYSMNGTHKFVVKLKLWLVYLLFRRDFRRIKDGGANSTSSSSVA